MKLQLTKQEYYKFLEYCAFIAENPNPCRNCTEFERITCFGCKTRKHWNKLCESKSNGLDQILELPNVQDHIVNISKHSDLVNQIVEMEKKKGELEDLIFEFEHSIPTEEE